MRHLLCFPIPPLRFSTSSVRKQRLGGSLSSRNIRRRNSYNRAFEESTATTFLRPCNFNALIYPNKMCQSKPSLRWHHVILYFLKRLTKAYVPWSFFTLKIRDACSVGKQRDLCDKTVAEGQQCLSPLIVFTLLFQLASRKPRRLNATTAMLPGPRAHV